MPNSCKHIFGQFLKPSLYLWKLSMNLWKLSLNFRKPSLTFLKPLWLLDDLTRPPFHRAVQNPSVLKWCWWCRHQHFHEVPGLLARCCQSMVCAGWSSVCHQEYDGVQDKVLPCCGHPASGGWRAATGPHPNPSCCGLLKGIERKADYTLVSLPLTGYQKLSHRMNRMLALLHNDYKPDFILRCTISPSSGEGFRPKSFSPESWQVISEQDVVSCEPPLRAPGRTSAGLHDFYQESSYSSQYSSVFQTFHYSSFIPFS